MAFDFSIFRIKNVWKLKILKPLVFLVSCFFIDHLKIFLHVIRNCCRMKIVMTLISHKHIICTLISDSTLWPSHRLYVNSLETCFLLFSFVLYVKKLCLNIKKKPIFWCAPKSSTPTHAFFEVYFIAFVKISIT